MKKLKNPQCVESSADYVTYVVVVHGMGEQRENETVIKVVNRFAEARRGARANDSRDVVTLGQACGQTGLSKLPATQQPWMEFEGIPANPTDPRSKIFLGEKSSTGKDLRFVDLCWAHILRDAHKHAGTDVEEWAKGLLGRLVHKHKDAEARDKSCARVPFWIRRVLYLLADTLLLVRFAMNFRFKKMKELVFVKYLGDVQVYGEYERCRGRAVRHFHDTMARIEAEHDERERKPGAKRREARYVIIAHSLGSIMSLDALLYAHALPRVRKSHTDKWAFPGYRGGDEKDKTPDTNWIWRVQSFVTLGSPIDKCLMLWWLNYRYLLNHADWFDKIASEAQNCDCSGPVRKSPIAHFNYCDELDPVGHNLNVARQTPAYKAVFKCREDVVFNRYAVPGVAHNAYWTDQELFGWILDRAVAGACVAGAPSRPRWFNLWVYCKLLFWLYCAVPLLILLGTYASLSWALQAENWRTAAVAAAAFSFLAYFGRCLTDLGIWWRQIQRQQSEEFWRSARTGDDSGRNQAEQPCEGGGPDPKQRRFRRRAARLFRVLVAAAPFAWAALTLATLRALDLSPLQCVLVLCGGSNSRLTLVALIFLLVVFCLFFLCRLPTAYRMRTVDAPGMCPRFEAGLWVLVCIAGAVLAAHPLVGVLSALPAEFDGYLEHAAIFGVLATIAYSYRLYRFVLVKTVLRCSKPRSIEYSHYASHP